MHTCRSRLQRSLLREREGVVFTHNEPIFQAAPILYPVFLSHRRISELLPQLSYRCFTPNVHDSVHISVRCYAFDEVEDGLVFPFLVLVPIRLERRGDVRVRVDNRCGFGSRMGRQYKVGFRDRGLFLRHAACGMRLGVVSGKAD